MQPKASVLSEVTSLTFHTSHCADLPSSDLTIRHAASSHFPTVTIQPAFPRADALGQVATLNQDKNLQMAIFFGDLDIFDAAAPKPSRGAPGTVGGSGPVPSWCSAYRAPEVLSGPQERASLPISLLVSQAARQEEA